MANIVTHGIFAMLEKLDGVTKDRALVQPGDKTLHHLSGA
jgi:hypothetical protein